MNQENQDYISNLESTRKPLLRLFLSADIVDSTAYKNKPENDLDKQPKDEKRGFKPWFKAVLFFYHSSEQFFLRKWSEFKNSIPSNDDNKRYFGPPPTVWKTIGDEVIFVKDITAPLQALTTIHAWMDTLEDVSSQLTQKYGLTVKSSAWLADFPIKNTQMILGTKNAIQDEDHYTYVNQLNVDAYESGGKKNTNGDVLRDFIGPSIDTGFRLGAFATVRKLPLSIDLAYLLSNEQVKIKNGHSKNGPMRLSPFEFNYEGRKSLKGVLGGTPYPIIWIDRAPNNPVNKSEDELHAPNKPTAEKIREFSKSFIESQENHINIPFIFSEKDSHNDYSRAPNGLVEEIKEREILIESKKQSLEAEEKIEKTKSEKNEVEVKVDLQPFINFINNQARRKK